MYKRGTYTIFGLDIEEFHREDRDLATQEALRAELMHILDRALEDGGLHSAADILDRGDGALVIMSCRPLEVLTQVVPRLTSLLDDYNRGRPSRLVLRLRLALHVGLTSYDGRGYIGRDLTFAVRMLGSETMRRQLATTTRPIVLAVSDQVRDLAETARSEGPESLPKFGSLEFKNKETQATAWTAQLGRSVPAWRAA
ncbi:hypothetical protein K7640_08250 [Micromonospora sp. PLK6-60]|uniref:hypothetical protein n=1 Tax=Micromonospora sp. PLK6-60 TaxID=2873383 RepID=UPI001CA652D7|nr:hypothetical protein [Micromonospora sp. PLK6-60]MBY8871830.1 hypothetical protein [Micromonospora sp. PLK6-60]